MDLQIMEITRNEYRVRLFLVRTVYPICWKSIPIQLLDSEVVR